MSVKTRNQCFEEIRKALPEARAAAIEEILDEIDGMRSKIFGEKPELGSTEFLRQAQDFIEHRRLDRAREQLQRVQDVQKAEARMAYYEQPALKGQPYRAIEAKLVSGEAKQTIGGNFSAEGEKDVLSAKWRNQLLLGLEEQKLWDYAASGKDDLEIARALKDQNADVKPEAKSAASVIRGVYNAILTAKRNAGADVGEILGYIMRQSHNREAITASGFSDWAAFLLPKLDHDKTFGNLADPESKLAALQEIFDEIKGGYHGDYVPPGNIEKKLTRRRSLHFQDADGFMEYNGRFGTQNIVESVTSSIRSSARDVALLNAFGSNPRAALEADIRALRKANGAESITESQAKALRVRFDEVNDVTRRAPQSFAGRNAQNLQIWQTLTHMGSAALAQVGDLASMIAVTRSATDKSFLGSVGSVISEITSSLPKGNQKKWLLRGGKVVEDILADEYARFGATDPSAPGILAKSQRQFWRLNLMEGITQKSQGAMTAVIAKGMGDQAEKPFASLSGRWQKTLARYGIDEGLWEKIRQGTEDLGGDRAISQYSVEQLPDELFGGAKEKAAAATQVGVLLNDLVDMGVPHPGARQRALLLQGTLPDESMGIILRLAAQFKAFPLTVVNVAKRVGLSHPERMPNGWKDIFTLKGDNAGLAQFMLMATALGYVSMSLYDAAAGKEPQDPTDPATILKAMQRGGAAGLYGDFIFGEFNKYGGRGVWEAVVGPTFQDFGSIAELYSRALRGDAKAYEAVNWASRQVPFSNLFYTKHAFDSLVVNNLQDLMRPGYTRRVERFSRERQNYFLSPSDIQSSVGGLFQ